MKPEIPLDKKVMAALTTEQRNPKSMDIDSKSVSEILEIINDEDRLVPEAVRRAVKQIAEAVEVVLNAFRGGGRLFYVGAGTSGRLGVLDASECPPTFSVDPQMVQGIIAGGYDALVRSIEGAEDFPEDGAKALSERGIKGGDVVFGIATSGTTPFVLGAIGEAKRMGAKTVFLTCNEPENLEIEADVIIPLVVGPELVTGSTRMKAGTATKLVLNMITTTAMIKLGKVYENLMVDLKVWNNKLRDRACRILMTFTDLDYEESAELLKRADMSLKTAIVMGRGNVGYEEAVRRLEAFGGVVRKAIEPD